MLLRKSAFCLFVPLLFQGLGCGSKAHRVTLEDSHVRTFTLSEFTPQNGGPDWATMRVSIQPADQSRPPLLLVKQRAEFENRLHKDLQLSVVQGIYTLVLSYHNAEDQLLYESCPEDRAQLHRIFENNYQAHIKICLAGTQQAVGSTETSAESSVTLYPEWNESTAGAEGKGTGAACMRPHYGLSTAAIPSKAQGIPYPEASLTLQLPSLRLDASNLEIKQFVAKVYDAIPTFAKVYEGELGLTRTQALAFMYADMSRESASGERWRIDLETGIGGPGHAWGPFQAAETNYRGGAYDKDIGLYHHTGLPILPMSQFKDPASATYTGMKRLADGVLRSIKEFGPGRPAQDYLLGTLADHNTGWPKSALDANWQKDYGLEVLRLMQAYQFGNNMKNDRAFWTTQPEDQICR